MRGEGGIGRGKTPCTGKGGAVRSLAWSREAQERGGGGGEEGLFKADTVNEEDPERGG